MSNNLRNAVLNVATNVVNELDQELKEESLQNVLDIKKLVILTSHGISNNALSMMKDYAKVVLCDVETTYPVNYDNYDIVIFDMWSPEARLQYIASKAKYFVNVYTVAVGRAFEKEPLMCGWLNGLSYNLFTNKWPSSFDISETNNLCDLVNLISSKKLKDPTYAAVHFLKRSLSCISQSCISSK